MRPLTSHFSENALPTLETVLKQTQEARVFGRSPGARSIPQALGPLLRKALHPFSERGSGQVEGGGDGVDTLGARPMAAQHRKSTTYQKGE